MSLVHWALAWTPVRFAGLLGASAVRDAGLFRFRRCQEKAQMPCLSEITQELRQIGELRFALGKRGDAKLGGRIRNQRDGLFRLIACDGTWWQGIGDSIFRAPAVQPARTDGKAHRRMFRREGAFADLSFLHSD